MPQRIRVVIAVLLALIIGVALTKNVIAKAVVSAGVKSMTGLTLHLQALDVGVLRSAIGVRGLQLHNPAGFSDPVMVDLPELYVHYDLPALLTGKVHLREVRLHLKEFAVIKNAQGQLNLDALKAVQASKSQAAATPSSAKGQAPAEKAPDVRIDTLTLKIGHVIYRDYTRATPLVQEFPVNIDERYEHINNPYVLTSLIISRALVQTTVARLTGFDLHALQGQLDQQVALATQLATAGVGKATAAAKDAANLGKDAVGAAGATVQETTDALKKLNPFGR